MGGMGEAVAVRDHVVHFYDSPSELVAAVARFIRDGFAEGAVAVLIARPDLGEAIRDDLRWSGVDAGPDRFRVIDAAGALEAFMADGLPDRQRFFDVIGTVIEEASRGGVPVRAFGEMVSLLWDEGNAAAAIELEGLWNELCRAHELSLYCAYPIGSLSGADDLRAATEICVRHTDVIAPASYLTGATPAEGGPERSQVFIPTRSATTGARRFVEEALHDWMLEHLVRDASIVIAELAANAVMHAASAFRVSVTRAGTKVKIAVEDADTTEPARRERSDSAEGGFGMALIHGISSTTGLHVTPDGKTVWALVGD